MTRSISSPSQGQPSLNPLGVQFFSSLEGIEITTSPDRQLIRGHNLVGAVRLQFARPGFFDDEAGEHGEIVDGVDGIDVALSMHVYPFPEIGEWESRWFYFDVQLHPYQLHFQRKVVDGDESAVGIWEDSYGKLAQVRGQMCFQPYVQPCSPPLKEETSFKEYRSIFYAWMKNSSEGGFAPKKWMYGRGSIVGVLKIALLEEQPRPGQDILVVLVDEFGFTSRASFDVGGASGNSVSPQKARTTNQGKVRNALTSSPIGSPAKRPARPSLAGVSTNEKGNGKERLVEEDESPETVKELLSSPKPNSPSITGIQPEQQQGLNGGKEGREDELPAIVVDSEGVNTSQGRSALKRGTASTPDATPRKRANARK
ncbi:hypothetical protein NPX13_g4987 [Xylaria arbuscula]|uniref:Uncharacterized protein n=1 Tax=Xylaria arbuscula TaxID=114810 RepID=A0A9W8NEH2_9PEZI|nr:hypothetical protein NPX13_g4987 [Xylaria arbuscula]